MTENVEVLSSSDTWELSSYTVDEVKGTFFDFKYIRTTKKYDYYLKNNDMLYRILAKSELLGGGSRIDITWTSTVTETYLLGYTNDRTKMIAIGEEAGGFFYVSKEANTHGVSVKDIARCIDMPVEKIAIVTRKEA